MAEEGHVEAVDVRRISARAWVIGLVVMVTGAVLLVLGGVLDDKTGSDVLSDYWDGILGNVGVALFLLGPLFLVERAITGQLNRVDSRVRSVEIESRAARAEVDRVSAEATATLDRLSRDVQAGLQAIRDRDQRLHDTVLDEVTQRSLFDLYARAKDLGAVDRLGIRVSHGDPPFWIRARAVERQDHGDPAPVPLVELDAEDKDGAPISGASAIWSPGEEAHEPFVRIAAGLQAAARFPGEDEFDAGQIIADIAAALRQVIALRTSPAGTRPIRPIIEIVNDDWAVTESGLDALQFDLWAERDELVREADQAFERLEGSPHVQAAGRIDPLKEAFDVAQAIHVRRHRESPGAILGDLFRR